MIKLSAINPLYFFLCTIIVIDPKLQEYFSSEPFNTTVFEGETIKFNCTSVNPTVQNFATWVIGGFQYYFADLLNSPLFIFSAYDNSLTVRNASRSLDGYSFQCILNRRSSNIGYLNVVVSVNTTVSSPSTFTDTG